MRKLCYIILTTLFLASTVALQAARKPATTKSQEQSVKPTATARTRGEPAQPAAPTQLTLKVGETKNITVPNDGTITGISDKGAAYVSIAADNKGLKGTKETGGTAYDITVIYEYTKTTGRGTRAKTTTATGSLAYKIIVGEGTEPAPAPKTVTKNIDVTINAAITDTLTAGTWVITKNLDSSKVYASIEGRTITFTGLDVTSTPVEIICEDATAKQKAIYNVTVKKQEPLQPGQIILTAGETKDESILPSAYLISTITMDQALINKIKVEIVAVDGKNTSVKFTAIEPTDADEFYKVNLLAAAGRRGTATPLIKTYQVKITRTFVETKTLDLATTDAKPLVVSDPKIVFTQTLSEIIQKAALTEKDFPEADTVAKVSTDIQIQGLTTTKYGISIGLYDYLKNPVSLDGKTFTVELQSKTHKAKVTFKLAGPTYEAKSTLPPASDPKIWIDDAGRTNGSTACRAISMRRIGWWAERNKPGVYNKGNDYFIIDIDKRNIFALLDNFGQQESANLNDWGKLLTNLDNCLGNWVGFCTFLKDSSEAKITAARASVNLNFTFISTKENKSKIDAIVNYKALIPAAGEFMPRDNDPGHLPINDLCPTGMAFEEIPN